MTSIADKALLTQLQVSQWTARKYDRKATEKVAQDNNADVTAGRYNKSLLPMTDALKRVHQYTTVIRTEYYSNTLPWGINGTQILPARNFMEFSQEFRAMKGRWLGLVSDFCGDYVLHKHNAQQFLGSLYNEDDYPDATEIRRKFSIDMSVFPVPTNDFRVQIGNDELQRIQKDVETRVQDAASNAMQEVWKRLYERVSHMADKLGDPSSIFRDTLVENTVELCALLPKLNFMDDPDLEAARQEVEAKLCYDPDSLRHDLDLRKDVAGRAKDIADKMGAFMGGVQ